MPEEFFKPPSQVATEQNALKANLATRICNAHKELGPALVNKNWLLFETNRCLQK